MRTFSTQFPVTKSIDLYQISNWKNCIWTTTTVTKRSEKHRRDMKTLGIQFVVPKGIHFCANERSEKASQLQQQRQQQQGNDWIKKDLLQVALLLAEHFDAGAHAEVLDMAANVVHERRHVDLEQRLFAQVHGGLYVAAIHKRKKKRNVKQAKK